MRIKLPVWGHRLVVIAWISAWILAIAGCGSPSADSLQSLSAVQIKTLISQHKNDDGFVILDVRTPAEYQQGHIDGAVLLDYYSPTFKQAVGALDKSKTYLIYCRSGSRSGKSLRLFNELGFQKVYHLANGILEWTAKGYPLVKGDAD